MHPAAYAAMGSFAADGGVLASRLSVWSSLLSPFSDCELLTRVQFRRGYYGREITGDRADMRDELDCVLLRRWPCVWPCITRSQSDAMLLLWWWVVYMHMHMRMRMRMYMHMRMS